MLTYSYDRIGSKYLPWIFVWHFYNFALFQHCLPIFSVVFSYFSYVKKHGSRWTLWISSMRPPKHRSGVPHVFFGASAQKDPFCCWFMLILIFWKVLSSCITYHNISQHITTYQHVVLSETFRTVRAFRTFRTHLTRFWRLSFRVAWRRAVPNFAPGQTAGRAAARARQDMASGARFDKIERKKYERKGKKEEKEEKEKV